jgi:hemerythrin-like metal-binding protein
MIHKENFIHYVTGITKVDDQHWEIAKLLNQIAKDAKSGNKENVKELIPKLSKMMQDHFDEEEAYMARINFPYIQSHINSHAEIIKEVNRVESTCKDRCSRCIVDKLRDLFLHEMDHLDFQIVDYLKKKEV